MQRGALCAQRLPVTESAASGGQLAANQHAADFVGAGTDVVQLGVAQKAAGGVFIDIAVAAQGLYRFQRDINGISRGVEIAGGRVDSGMLVAVVGTGYLVGKGA